MNPTWKPDWQDACQHHIDWWSHEGMVLSIDAPLDHPRIDLPRPCVPNNLRDRWLDPVYRSHQHEFDLAHRFLGGDTVPMASTVVSAGDLSAMLGCPWIFSESTVWAKPCIDDPDQSPTIQFDPTSPVFNQLVDLVNADFDRAAKRYLVGIPDLVENFDILAAMRGTQLLLTDLYDRPSWVHEQLAQINRAFFTVFDLFFDQVKDEAGGNIFCAFGLWGPGKTAKVQCDAAAMLSPAHFIEFVVPPLTEQCHWLDYAMFHLDGEDALRHLDALLAIDALDAIEWTPRYCSVGDTGGSAKWYDLYRRILKAGKSVQAVSVRTDQVIPLLDAVGPAGMYLHVSAASETEAQQLVDDVKAYR